MVDQLSQAFQALADPTRRDIVARLAADGAASVSDLAAAYDMSLQAVSKHVAVLEEAGVVSRSRDGRRRPVHFDGEVLDLMAAWIERYRSRAEARYRRLDELLAREASTDGERHGSGRSPVPPDQEDRAS